MKMGTGMLRMWQFWVVAAAALVVCFGLYVAFPYLVADAKWVSQKHYVYRGVGIDLPFGWVEDANGAPVTFTRPKSSLMNGGLDSTVSIHRIDASPEARVKVMNIWLAKGGVTRDGSVAMEGGGQNRTLLCRAASTNLTDLSLVDCMSGDGSWRFYYMGEQVDLDAAKGIMRSVMGHDAGWK